MIFWCNQSVSAAPFLLKQPRIMGNYLTLHVENTHTHTHTHIHRHTQNVEIKSTLSSVCCCCRKTFSWMVCSITPLQFTSVVRPAEGGGVSWPQVTSGEFLGLTSVRVGTLRPDLLRTWHLSAGGHTDDISRTNDDITRTTDDITRTGVFSNVDEEAGEYLQCFHPRLKHENFSLWTLKIQIQV